MLSAWLVVVENVSYSVLYGNCKRTLNSVMMHFDGITHDSFVFRLNPQHQYWQPDLHQ